MDELVRKQVASRCSLYGFAQFIFVTTNLWRPLDLEYVLQEEGFAGYTSTSSL